MNNDPRMCSAQDRNNEMVVADILSRKTGRMHVMAGRDCVYDFALVSPAGEPYAIVETKRRKMWWGQYPTLHFGEAKGIGCLAEAKRRNCKFLFAVLCDDGLYVADLPSLDGFARKKSGRFDRRHLNISTDEEIMIHIPLNKFVKIQ